MRDVKVTLVAVLCGLFLVGCSKSPAEPPAALSDAVLESKAKSFVTFMADGKHADAVKMMDAKVSAALPADRLKSTWDSIISQAGAFDRITGTRIADESGFKVVYVTCKFKAAALDTKVVFDAAGLVSGLWFLPSQTNAQYSQPSYADTESFTETDCEVGSGKWVLPATLTMPKGDGPFPAVVLVHGSGPHDRDETIGPNKPFKDLAWGLASNGIAVLRYEKRTNEYSQNLAPMMDTFTVNEETVNDALEAVKYLRQAPGIDPNRVFIVGHSLGASMAPRIAGVAEEGGGEVLAGLVMMAPNARPLLDLVLEQYEYIMSLDGQVTESEASELEKVRSDVAKIKSGAVQPGEVVLGAGKAYWDDLIGYDPVAAAKSLSLPMLILQGERDYQVTMEDFGIWLNELGTSGNVTLKSFPGLNHLFIHGEGKPSPDEYGTPGNIYRGVIETIAEWVKAK